MEVTLEKCQVIVPGRVWYQKAKAILKFPDDNLNPVVEVYNRRERLLDTLTGPKWVKLPGQDWEIQDEEGHRLVYVEITGGCNCGGTQTTFLPPLEEVNV